MVRVYSIQGCPYCVKAKALLRQRGIQFQEIDVTSRPEMRQWLVQQTGRKTVPQIFINDKCIGGASDLEALDSAGMLMRML